jgi:hypothetical protein
MGLRKGFSGGQQDVEEPDKTAGPQWSGIAGPSPPLRSSRDDKFRGGVSVDICLWSLEGACAGVGCGWSGTAGPSPPLRSCRDDKFRGGVSVGIC